MKIYDMGLITTEIAKFTNQEKLGFVATVSVDNTPNLSPKGTVFVLDEDHLAFADIKSPQTIKNLQNNPSVEINVVNPILRKGFRFKGSATIHYKDAMFSQVRAKYIKRGIKSKINSIVVVKVDTVKEVTSPLYDQGYTEDEIKASWKNHYK